MLAGTSTTANKSRLWKRIENAILIPDMIGNLIFMETKSTSFFPSSRLYWLSDFNYLGLSSFIYLSTAVPALRYYSATNADAQTFSGVSTSIGQPLSDRNLFSCCCRRPRCASVGVPANGLLSINKNNKNLSSSFITFILICLAVVKSYHSEICIAPYCIIRSKRLLHVGEDANNSIKCYDMRRHRNLLVL